MTSLSSLKKLRSSMKLSKTGRLAWLLQQAPVWLPFLLGLWLIVLRPLGSHLENIPGDLVDARFNSYVLEHFYRWLTGLDRGFWNAAIFFPYQLSIAFSDNLLGAAPLYAFFRFAGLDRIAAFQGWYLLSFCCNYLTAAYVLSRLKLALAGVGVGAFFFTFGLPVLAQENHAQLLYRFCIPLACFFLWRFYEKPRLGTLVAVGFWVTWQFYLTIYIGIFLLILLAALAVLLPVFVPEPRLVDRLTLWPRTIAESLALVQSFRTPPVRGGDPCPGGWSGGPPESLTTRRPTFTSSPGPGRKYRACSPPFKAISWQIVP